MLETSQPICTSRPRTVQQFIARVRNSAKKSAQAAMVLCLATLAFGTAFGGQRFSRFTPAAVNMPLVPATKGYRYVLTDAFPGLQFTNPVWVVTPPGETNRIYVIERRGIIYEVPDLRSPKTNVFMNITDRVASDWDAKKVEGLSSLAFHPGFATNGLFYVTYTCVTTNSPLGTGNHNRLSRFQILRNSHFGNPDSEVVLISQYDRGDGHNFNDVAFGPDGYLYMSTGDEGDGGGGDDFHNSQRIDANFFSGMIRIDVDKRPGNLAPNPHPAISGHDYLVPADNPWVGATSFDNSPVNPNAVRTEFYAVGLRNPWRFSFDPLTDEIYEGDVGQHKREEINVIVKGGNYGWSYTEGTDIGPKGEPPAWLNWIPPIVEYVPGFGPYQGFSVTGGVVYRGDRIPSLYGAYVFADYVSGNLWSVRYENGQTNNWNQLLVLNDGSVAGGIASFGYDPRNGDVLAVDHLHGKILRLDYIDMDEGSNLPLSLADTGLFSDVSNLTLKQGFVPYDVNMPFWSDGALKRRWFALLSADSKIGQDSSGMWQFPDGAVWVKHFDLEMEVGNPASRKRVETRVLVKNSGGVYGVTYRWGDSTSNAQLVPSDGQSDIFTINDNGQTRTLTWKYPSRQECLTCHTPLGGYALGFNLAQLNRDYDFADGKTNQLFALSDAGYFSRTLSNYFLLPAYAAVDDESSSREYRVRSYLSVNCAYCHQPGGTGRGTWDGRSTIDLWHAGLVNGPLIDSRANPEARVVVPGSITNSMIHQRITEDGTYHMPPLGPSSVDTEFENLLSTWITTDLPNAKSFEQWQAAYFGSASAPSAAPDADPDHDGLQNLGEYLLGTNPTDPNSHWRATIADGATQGMLSFPTVQNRAIVVEKTVDVTSGIWNPVIDPANAFRFPATGGNVNTILVPKPNGQEYYRFKVIAP